MFAAASHPGHGFARDGRQNMRTGCACEGAFSSPFIPASQRPEALADVARVAGSHASHHHVFHRWASKVTATSISFFPLNKLTSRVW
jgi:hypothetical protein